MKLRKQETNIRDLNYLTFITHSSFEHWQHELNQVIYSEGQ